MSGKGAIAIDVGGVLIIKDGISTTEDTVISSSGARWMPGALEAVEALTKAGYECWVLSFAGRQREQDTIKAFNEAGFRKLIPAHRWIFVKSREAKMPAMFKHGLDLLIDDTKEIIDDVRAGGFKAIWFGHETKTWPEVVAALIK